MTRRWDRLLLSLAFCVCSASPVAGMDFLAADIAVYPVAAGPITAGTPRVLVLDFEPPTAGYEGQFLQRLNFVQLGSARAGIDVTGTEAWVDDGDGIFDGASDERLGSLQFTGNRWELTGANRILPAGGLRLFLTADVGASAEEGRTLRYGLPALPDFGIGLSQSGGPTDQVKANPGERVVTATERLTASAVSIPSTSVPPGTANVPLMQLELVNGYSQPRTLAGLTVGNAAMGAGSPVQLDGLFETLTLHGDADGDGVLDLAVDPVLAVGVFTDGRCFFTGIGHAIAGDGTEHLFLSANVATDAADGDVLAAVVALPGDFVFLESTGVAGTWPLDSGARHAVDGFLASQMINHVAPVATVAPGDGPVVALDVTVPANGYQPDVLNSVRVQNLGTAAASDLTNLHLWRDDGDGVFQGGGADVDLGALVFLGGFWNSAFLTEAVAVGGSRLFVSADISPTASDSTTLLLALPTMGVEMASSNDGPLDLPVANPHAIVLSSSPLLSSLSISPPFSTLGASVEVRMPVRNVGSETITGISPTPLLAAGSGVLTLASGPNPPAFDLAVGAADTFVWNYTAVAAGNLTLQGNAEGIGMPSGLSRRSVETRSNQHDVRIQATSTDVFATDVLPPSVNVGQEDLVALHLTFTHGGAAGSSDILVHGLQLEVEDGAGVPLAPDAVLDRVRVREGTVGYLDTTNIPPSGSLDLSLQTPVRITTQEQVTISIAVGVGEQVASSSLRLRLNEGAIDARDAVSGATVTTPLLQGVYPFFTSTASLTAPATEVVVEERSAGEVRVHSGSHDVSLARFSLTSSGDVPSAANVVVSSLEIELTDGGTAPLTDPAQYIERLRVLGTGVMADMLLVSGSLPSRLALTSPILLPTDQTVEVQVVADLVAGAPVATLGVRLTDASRFDARDTNSGGVVPARYLTAPMSGPPVRVQRPATELRIAATGVLPATVAVGQTGVAAMQITLSNPGDAATASVRPTSLSLQLRDGAGNPILASNLLDEVRVLAGATEVTQLAAVPAQTSVLLPMAALRVDPLVDVVLELQLDIQATAPETALELRLDDGGLLAVDDVTGSAVSVLPDGSSAYPFSSLVTELRPPPRQLHVDLQSLMPATIAADGRQISVGRVLLENRAPAGSGDILLTGLELRGADLQGAVAAVGSAISSLTLSDDDGAWAVSEPLDLQDPTATVSGPEISIASGSTLALTLNAVLRPDATATSIRLGFEAADVAVVQPSSPLLAIDVLPAGATAFPQWTHAGVFATAQLEESFANFPNPFAAGREDTQFVFYLPETARVSLELWTARGEHVRTLARDEVRAAGMQQIDSWDGRNGRGRPVLNDVFLAELVVTLDSGKTTRLIRKVAVIR